MSWTWKDASNAERGRWIRHHAGIGKICPTCKRYTGGKALTRSALLDLFCLTDKELDDVLAGCDYPEQRAVVPEERE